eukprot:CAMPEP_0174250694 /NCGR_PEP_ID=MMETSP0439-20130205/785_1 /TAXON_ID=0 /ORGANISM="Stereomyxa ramosa, Strain Chinc5" /LENGTH=690 /DNA_ID=CAMNT_0015330829 /DNA_START=22 /DNA_END=2094 /DNA_ORIENTATION=+
MKWGVVLLVVIFPCFAFSSIPPVLREVGVEKVVEWTNNRILDAEQKFVKGGFLRQPSPENWEEYIVYEIQVDRFQNGNLTNDAFNLPENQAKYQNTPNPYGLQDYRHGGDIQGITDRLDYLQDLGINSLWITPVLMHTGDYHGYCTTDLTKIDPGFGTEDEFVELVQQAHSRGIMVILDIVVNHLCDQKTNYSTFPDDHEACAADLNTLYWNGVPGESSHQGELSFSDQFFGPLKSEYYFSRCGPNSADDTAGSGPATVFGDFVAGMFDYDTRNYDFQEIFTNLHKYWIATADIDGYRMDAAKHVTEDFIAYFSTEIRDYASSIGKKNFYLIGEVAGAADWQGRRLGKMFTDPTNPDDHGNVPASLVTRIKFLMDTYLKNSYAPYPGLNGIYDFVQSGTARDVLLDNKGSQELGDYFISDAYNTISGQNDPKLNWVLVEIHDWPRFLHDRPTNPYKVIGALGFLMAAQGMPIIYYGLEHGLNGNCHEDNIHAGNAAQGIIQACNEDSDSCKRQDMFLSDWRLGSGIEVIDELNYIGIVDRKPPVDWRLDPFLNTTHFLYQTARKLTHIRQSCSVLSLGAFYFRAGGGKGAFFAFSRIKDGAEIVIIVNPNDYSSTSVDKILIDSSINPNSGSKFINLLNPAEVGYVGKESGSTYLYFSGYKIGSNTVSVFVQQANVGDWNSDLNTALCKH